MYDETVRVTGVNIPCDVTINFFQGVNYILYLIFEETSAGDQQTNMLFVYLFSLSSFLDIFLREELV